MIAGQVLQRGQAGPDQSGVIGGDALPDEPVRQLARGLAGRPRAVPGLRRIGDEPSEHARVGGAEQPGRRAGQRVEGGRPHRVLFVRQLGQVGDRLGERSRVTAGGGRADVERIRLASLGGGRAPGRLAQQRSGARPVQPCGHREATRRVLRHAAQPQQPVRLGRPVNARQLVQQLDGNPGSRQVTPADRARVDHGPAGGRQGVEEPGQCGAVAGQRPGKVDERGVGGGGGECAPQRGAVGNPAPVPRPEQDAQHPVGVVAGQRTEGIVQRTRKGHGRCDPLQEGQHSLRFGERRRVEAAAQPGQQLRPCGPRSGGKLGLDVLQEDDRMPLGEPGPGHDGVFQLGQPGGHLGR